jgi:N-acetylmuramoyl-L-alanine amidase
MPAFSSLRRAILLAGGACLLAASSLRAYTVVIDPGHGGADRGGIPGQRRSEKAMTLDTALRLRDILAARKIKVKMTRADDRFIPLDERSDIANATDDAVFVSIHFDAYRTRHAEGITTLYYSRESRSFAEAVHAEMRRRLRPSVNRGVQKETLAVLHHNQRPAILVEGGYLTSPVEGARIDKPAYRQDMALAIADGIAKFER